MIPAGPKVDAPVVLSKSWSWIAGLIAALVAGAGLGAKERVSQPGGKLSQQGIENDQRVAAEAVTRTCRAMGKAWRRRSAGRNGEAKFFPKHLRRSGHLVAASSCRDYFCPVLMGGIEMGRTILARMAGAGVALLCSVAVASAAEVKLAITRCGREPRNALVPALLDAGAAHQVMVAARSL